MEAVSPSPGVIVESASSTATWVVVGAIAISFLLVLALHRNDQRRRERAEKIARAFDDIRDEKIARAFDDIRDVVLDLSMGR